MRNASGWLLLHVRENTIDEYGASIPIADEAWLFLHQVAEVADTGCAFVARFQPNLTPAQTHAAWREFRAYVRQAESFFRAAAPLPWKSAPLNYYYAFLNLAKALLSARGKLPAGKVHHGLSSVFPAPQSTVKDWHVQVRDGVFALLYEHGTKQPIAASTPLNIGQLLGYGIRQNEDPAMPGRINPQPIDSYKWQGKEIPAGFFKQPDTEHISAVISNPEGTISKFNRMGFLSNFGDRDIHMIRSGLAYQGATSPQHFVVEIEKAKYEESWCEGLEVFHNPNALVPLPEFSMPEAAHTTVRNGQIVSSHPPFFPVGSMTLIVTTSTDDNAAALERDQ